jgi:hypothetical protein
LVCFFFFLINKCFLKIICFIFSYLVRFLARVAEHSSENKMPASNLGICIGCSILYPKEQVSNSSISNSFTNGSTILEIMINNHKQLFTNNSQFDEQSFKSQPDLIPTEFHPVH